MTKPIGATQQHIKNKPNKKEQFDALNKATLHALRTAGLTRERMEKTEQMLKNKEFVSGEEYEQYLLDCEYFHRHTPLKIVNDPLSICYKKN
jgi:hypothetical protein